ncbi:MAG TPA: alpha/beta fold hydrolase [Casimicrobiaceae bacterium]|nr:alpha/beta fold hydrolase [Casimicrobiaceae bacterium]
MSACRPLHRDVIPLANRGDPPAAPLLIPGLMGSPRLCAAQMPSLWKAGPIAVADPTRADSVAEVVRGILADAPPRFALAGHSFGGYVAFGIMRHAPERVAALALLDTSARADVPEQSQRHRDQVTMARTGPFAALAALRFPAFVHRSRATDRTLQRYMRVMAEDTDADVFARKQTAMIGRPEARGTLAAIGCPAVVEVADADAATPPERAQEISVGIAGARLVTIAQCGHMTPVEKPDVVAAVLAEPFGAAPGRSREPASRGAA